MGEGFEVVVALEGGESMARDDREDWVLLRLVVCVAIATVAMAIASTLPM